MGAISLRAPARALVSARGARTCGCSLVKSSLRAALSANATFHRSVVERSGDPRSEECLLPLEGGEAVGDASRRPPKSRSSSGLLGDAGSGIANGASAPSPPGERSTRMFAAGPTRARDSDLCEVLIPDPGHTPD